MVETCIPDKLVCEMPVLVPRGLFHTNQNKGEEEIKMEKVKERTLGGVITEFQGEYRFLSNFWPAELVMDGITYPTVEHAYQAAKTLDQRERLIIMASPTPGDAKRRGRRVRVRPDWEKVKIPIMRQLVEAKFQHPELAKRLIITYPKRLEEGNKWGDRFWGVCGGEGQNHLGRILMRVRESLMRGGEQK